MDAGDKIKTINLIIKGMHCESCARIIESMFEDKGITASVDFKTGTAKANYNSEDEKIKILKTIKLVMKKGYIVNFL